MSEPAEVLQNISTALAQDSDQFFYKENLKLVDLEKGLNFFKGQCIVHVANSPALRQKAYELLYYLYSKMGITQKKDPDLWLSIFDALPETTTFVAENYHGCIAGALTVVFDSPIGLPADELYKEEIDELRNSDGKICEFVSLGTNNTVISPLKILAGLFYCAFVHAWWRNNSTELVITVHSRYENFYRRCLFFDKIGPERSYAKVNGAPTVLLKLSLMEINRLRHKNRFFPFTMIAYSGQKELEIYKYIENMASPMSDEEFFTFFIEKTDTWEKASSKQKHFIKKVYPSREVNHYAVSRALAKAFSKKNLDSGDTRTNSTRVFKR